MFNTINWEGRGVCFSIKLTLGFRLPPKKKKLFNPTPDSTEGMMLMVDSPKCGTAKIRDCRDYIGVSL